jgi:TonB-linked SusC/RagA family outer membrane protein
MTKLYPLTSKILLLCLCMLSFRAYPQSARPVSGKVTSTDESAGLPGVNVLEKGTSNGTVTDSEGNYTIRVREGAVLVFSFVGYTSQEVQAAQDHLDISLTPDIATLNEVVIIGYGTVKKTDATGSVATVDSRSFNKGVVNSPQELLMGKTAGVLVTSNSGAPGNTSTIRIRGGSSLSANNDPLIIIDGVPVTNNGLGGSPNIFSIVNPNDIESYTVLKDASATAIYGLRASNGVILITTKRGGKDLKITYSATGTMYTAPKHVNVYNGDEFRALVQQQLATNPDAIALLSNSNTDWQKEIYNKAAYGQDHNLSLSGTALKTPYRVSFGYNNTDGILKKYNYNRSTLSVGIDPSLLDNHLKVNINFKGMINGNNFSEQGAIPTAVGYDPTRPVYNGNTRWRGYTTWTQDGLIDGDPNPLAPANPVAMIDLTDNTSTVKRTIGSIKLDYELPVVKNLHAILNLGYDHADTKGHNNVPSGSQWVYTGGGRNNPYSAVSKNQLLDFYLNYAPNLNSDNHKFDVMAGHSWSHFYYAGGDSTMNASVEAPADRVNVYKSEFFLLSFFGRMNYTFKDKYLFTATVRDDLTSRFSKDNRSAIFPSLALGWKISQENFLKNSKVVSELKLRLGYGVTGQQDIVGSDYPYIATFTRSDNAARYQFGNQFYNTIRPDGYNANIKWETTKTYNAAIDYGFFQNRLTGSLDVYSRKSYDLISIVPPAIGTNFSTSIYSNIGNITNKGVELNINAEVISREDLQWFVGYNVTYNQNEVEKLNLNNDPKFIVPVGGVGGTTSGTIQVQKLGSPRSSFYVYQQVYGTDGKPLEDVYVDRNNDGVINTSDLYVYKKPDPTVYMGINSRLNYKNFDFSFSGRANFGNYVYNNVAANSTYRALYDIGILSNVSKQAEKTKFNPATNTRFSDFYVENGAFFRLDNVNLGYTFKEVFHEKLNIRVGAGAQNVFVITKYSGLDPEVQGGLDNNFFPRTRSFFLNVNAQF